jgi:hypothetical protein
MHVIGTPQYLMATLDLLGSRIPNTYTLVALSSSLSEEQRAELISKARKRHLSQS